MKDGIMIEVRTQRPKSDRKSYGLLTFRRVATFFASQLTIETPFEAKRWPPVITGLFCALQICFKSLEKRSKHSYFPKKLHQCFFTNFQKFMIFIQKSSGKRWIKQIREKTAIHTHRKASLQTLAVLDKIPVFC